MKLLVTGGLGFIGSNFIAYWFRKYRQDTIINVDKMSYASDSAYLRDIEGQFDYKFVRGDISDKPLMNEALKDIDLVVNIAAESHVDNSITNSDDFVRSNFMGVKNILDVVNERSIRFHQVSTDEVFGTLPNTTKSKFRISSRYKPRNPYSASKAAADLMIGAYVNTYGINATISYSGNNYGPHQHPEKFVPKIILHSILGRKIPVYGAGKQIRDWVYVEDHCSALEAIIKKGKSGQRYLVSSGEELPNLSLVRKIIKLVGKDEALIEYIKDRPGHDFRYSSDSSLTRKRLGWEPAYTIETGLKETVDHYTDNFSMYESKLPPK